MGEPISNESSCVNLKGITFRKDQLSEKQFFNGKPFVSNAGIVVPMNGAGYETYSVTLKDGTKVQYAEQPAENKANIEIGKSGAVYFNGVSNAMVYDTPDNDRYGFCSCSDVSVFAKREKTIPVGHSRGGGVSYGEHDITISDDKDRIDVNFCQNMTIEYTQGSDKVFVDSVGSLLWQGFDTKK